MTGKEIQFRKKREIGEIITDSFIFLKQESRPLSNIILIYVVPFILLYAVLQVFIMQKIMGTVVPTEDPEELIKNLWPVYKNLFMFLLFNVFVQSLYIGVAYSYIEVYIKKGKGNFTQSDISLLLFSNSLMALGVNIVITIIVIIGLIMCFLPGIYFANTLSASIFIFLFEKKGLNQSLSKSWNLVNSQWWNTFLLNIFGVAIIGIVGFIISIPTMIAGISVSLISIGQQEPVVIPDWYWVLSGFNTFVTSILYIIPFTFLAFQYFNLDERSKPVANLPVQE